MTITLNNLKRSKARSKPAKRVGRGWGSGKGKYSGRGVKGQKSRSGGRSGLKLKGMKAMMLNQPKLSSQKPIARKFAEISLSTLEKYFNEGDKVTSSKLAEKGLVPTIKFGVKLLNNGVLNKKLTIIVDEASAGAIAAVEKIGGKVIVTSKPEVKVEEAAK